MLKDTNCGELRLADAGRTVRIAGWVHRRRDHGGLIFIDLRDSSGIVQIVLNPDNATAHAAGHRARIEWVLQVEGVVAARDSATVNPNMPTGEVEVIPAAVTVLNEAQTPPFYINEPVEVDEQLRGKNVGFQLVSHAVEYARRHHYKITPVCLFAKSVFDKKPDFADVLAS